ncbi:ROK family protein [Photobacterium sp. ZSDE20]|uniref:ROK family protein n=1 Tax=Photobacterium pectinilyticum TaxID=2906793 RepID=A0ABT1N827_9GAMM|nr:ROK family protein [Photobacterium sp. ZSDE20]MCQ1060891.1 ROK family protein [Photobacterium sp. ZSDE20]MDD1828713.1 ROK family protein [Photobacterium sp. ZSDE20]
MHKLRPDTLQLSENEKRIIDIVWPADVITRSEVTSSVPFTQQSTHRIVESLLDKEVLCLGEPLARGRGKPSSVIALNTTRFYTIGLSFKDSGIYMRLANLRGESLIDAVLAVDNKFRDGVFKQLVEAVFSELQDLNISPEQLLGVGVSIPSYRVNFCGDAEVFQAFGQWPQLDYAAQLQRVFELPVWVENNANCSAIAELMLGQGNQYPSFLYLSFGHGYGSGLVWKKELMSGGFRNAGQIGRTFTHQERSFRPAMSNLMRYFSAQKVDMSAGLEAAVENNMPSVLNWYQDVEPMLIRSLRSFIGVFDPSAIVIGGSAPKAVKQLFEVTINKVLGEQILIGYIPPTIYYSDIAEWAEVKGASLLPIKKRLMSSFVS